MLHNEKEEINKWLRTKYPEVFVDGALEKLGKQIEQKDASFRKEAKKLAEEIRNKERPIVVEMDLVNHLEKRIDQYLFKSWPEIFEKGSLKELRTEINKIYDDLQGKEQRINANLEETRNQVTARLENIDTQLEELVKMVEEKTKKEKQWWRFWE